MSLVVLNGSPLFTGGAGSGESEIRRYVLENDLLEAIVGLPTDMFYNTGIATYVWIVSNRKPEDRKGYVQLIDASSFWQKMRKSLGSKRKEMSDAHIATVTRLFGDFTEAELVTVLDAQGPQGYLVNVARGSVVDVPLAERHHPLQEEQARQRHHGGAGREEERVAERVHQEAGGEAGAPAPQGEEAGEERELGDRRPPVADDAHARAGAHHREQVVERRRTLRLKLVIKVGIPGHDFYH